jgi:hypothetical protein
MSCFESTLWQVLEQRTLSTDSCSNLVEEFLWRMTSIEDDVLPIK